MCPLKKVPLPPLVWLRIRFLILANKLAQFVPPYHNNPYIRKMLHVKLPQMRLKLNSLPQAAQPIVTLKVFNIIFQTILPTTASHEKMFPVHTDFFVKALC